jgi:hypothetical protein
VAADELVLLKSTLPSAAVGISQPGFIDDYFSTAVDEYRTAAVGHRASVRAVNLRDDALGEITLI